MVLPCAGRGVVRAVRVVEVARLSQPATRACRPAARPESLPPRARRFQRPHLRRHSLPGSFGSGREPVGRPRHGSCNACRATMSGYIDAQQTPEDARERLCRDCAPLRGGKLTSLRFSPIGCRDRRRATDATFQALTSRHRQGVSKRIWRADSAQSSCVESASGCPLRRARTTRLASRLPARCIDDQHRDGGRPPMAVTS